MRDAIWNFLTNSDGRNALTLAVLIISTVVAVTTFRLNRKRKSIVYEFLSMTRLVSLKDEQSGRMRLLVDDIPVREVGLVQIRIVNVGTESIKATDFVRPISFSVTDAARIVEATVSEKNPPSIDAEISKDDHRAILTPTLINAKDSIVLKLLIADFDGAIKSDARIEGTELVPRRYFRNNRLAKFLRSTAEILPSLGGLGALTSVQLKNLDLDFPNDYRLQSDGAGASEKPLSIKSS
ncbi:MAG: hypothetical protein WCA10_06655 [Terracidiphilus sp.]